MLGHEQKSCKLPRVMTAHDKNRPKYGPFLSTNPLKAREAIIRDINIHDIQKKESSTRSGGNQGKKQGQSLGRSEGQS